VTPILSYLLSRTNPPKRPELPIFDLITEKDRVLILAPHPDDEALGICGILQNAIEIRIPVRVLYLTYGDHNELAFIAYRKRPWLSPQINRNMGEVRRREAIYAMAYLGLPEDNLVFLGYPDYGTLNIWKNHWGKAPPFRSLLTNVTSIPYKSSSSYGKPHKGEDILADIEQQLLGFLPTRIFVTHPVDGNPDHRSFYLFLQVALLNLKNRIPIPKVYTYPVHMGRWPRPHWYHPDYWLPWPRRLTDENSQSWTLELSQENVNRKYETIKLYKSQMSVSRHWLAAFARRNELFTTPQSLNLLASTSHNYHTLVVPTASTSDYEKIETETRLKSVSYQESEEGLVVKVGLKGSIEIEVEVVVYLFGYRYDKAFVEMPKICVEWGLDHLHVTDQSTPIVEPPVEIIRSLNEITMVIPWLLLGDPEILFVQGRYVRGETPVTRTAWRVLYRKYV